jgi:hypothetical protein
MISHGMARWSSDGWPPRDRRRAALQDDVNVQDTQQKLYHIDPDQVLVRASHNPATRRSGFQTPDFGSTSNMETL